MTYSHIFNNFDTPKISNFNSATLQLLMSSVLVSLSGALRIYIACILLQTTPSVFTCIAGGLIIYSVYTLDRTMDSEEDAINRAELHGSRKEIGGVVTLLTFVIGCYLLTYNGLLMFAFLPIISGYLYSKGIKIGRSTLKLKGGYGVKNIIVGLMWGVFITGLAGSTCGNIIPLLVVFTLFSEKVFVNSTIDDFKDIKGDTCAGISTLPICIGATYTHVLLYGMHISAHLILGIAILKGVLAFEPLIVFYSFICGLICIFRYTSEVEYTTRKIERTVVKDGEAAFIIILRLLASLAFVYHS